MKEGASLKGEGEGRGGEGRGGAPRRGGGLGWLEGGEGRREVRLRRESLERRGGGEAATETGGRGRGAGRKGGGGGWPKGYCAILGSPGAPVDTGHSKFPTLHGRPRAHVGDIESCGTSWADCIKMVRDRHPIVAEVIMHHHPALLRHREEFLVEAGLDIPSWRVGVPASSRDTPRTERPEVWLAALRTCRWNSVSHLGRVVATCQSAVAVAEGPVGVGGSHQQSHPD